MSLKSITIFLSSIPNNGGKYQYSLSMLEAFEKFNRTKYSISIVYQYDTWESIVKAKFDKTIFIKKNIFTRITRKITLSLPYGLSILRIISKYFDPIYKVIKTTNPDFVFYPGNDSLAYEYDFPSVIPIFDLMHRYGPNFPEVSGKIAKIRDKHYRNISKYVLGILVDSEVGKQQVIESYGTESEKIHILPYIAPDYIFKDEITDDILCNYNLPDKFVFYPAQFWTHKNHLNLLKAIFKLKNNGILINAVFVGAEKNMYYKIKNKIEELDLVNQVRILNYVSNRELVGFYKKAIALVMPTYFGPTNIPQLEAFSLGCPVVTSNIYGIPEQVGDAALLVDPNNFIDIAEKIEIIWTDHSVRDSLRNEGYKKVKIYSKDKFIMQLQCIIEQLIK